MIGDILRIVIYNPSFWVIFILSLGFPLYAKITRAATYTTKEFIAQIICGFALFLGTYSFFFAKTTDIENDCTMNTRVGRAVYLEPWTEKVSRRVCSGQNSCHTRVDYVRHPAQYSVIGYNEHSVPIQARDYSSFQQNFGQTRISVTHPNQTSLGDGGGFASVPKYSMPMSYSESYADYIKASQGTILKDQFQNKTDKFQNLLKPYPEIISSGFGKIDAVRIYDPARILGDTTEIEKSLDTLNMVYGPKKQMNIILAAVPNVPQEYGYALMQHWNAPRKNDVIILVSMDGMKIGWVQVKAFTKHELFKKELERKIHELGTIDSRIASIIQGQLDTPEGSDANFLREGMGQYEYLRASITLPIGWTIFLLLLFTGAHIGIAILFARPSRADQ